MSSADPPRVAPGAGAPPAGPLAGVRVIELASMISGPLTTGVLADQGADVIKLELPGSGDVLRQIGAARGGVSSIFQSLNRNKRSVALDLKAARGRELLLALVGRSDVFVQNFRPGVAERMGVGEAALRAVRQDLVYVSIDGFGATGPYAQDRVYDVVIQALSGMAASQSDPESGQPELVRNAVCDKVTALHAAQAVCAALFARERGAGGEHVRLSMLDASIAFLWPDVMQAETLPGAGASPVAPLGSLLRSYATRDGAIALLAISDEEFQGLCRVLARPELARDARFRDVAGRTENASALAEIVGAMTRSCGTRELCSRLAAEGVASAPINAPAAVAQDPQVIENRLLVERDHPVCGRVRIPRGVARFGGDDPELRRLAPLLGEHTDEVLAELGIGAEERAQLRAQGVTGALAADGS